MSSGIVRAEAAFLFIWCILFIQAVIAWKTMPFLDLRSKRWITRRGISTGAVESNDAVTPSVTAAEEFKRVNPMSDRISVDRFHHVEYYAGDATTTYKRFQHGLGLDLAAKSDFSTGNDVHASYMVQSGDMRMLITAPYNIASSKTDMSAESKEKAKVMPGFDQELATNFFAVHGFGVRAVAIVVDDVASSFYTMLQSGGKPALYPAVVHDDAGRGFAEVAEIALYGDVVLRLVNTANFNGAFWPNFEDVPIPAEQKEYGRYSLYRFDHIVGNVWNMNDTKEYMKNMTGFHEFAEFVAEDVGTVDSGLNSVVLANNNEMVLLPVNEPTFGTRRKSQIQTYLEQNRGEGVQHLALFSRDVFHTLRCMRAAGDCGGFEFMAAQPAEYYQRARRRIGDSLSDDQYKEAEELGILLDKDDQGVLLQIFTKPLGDRPTIFFEIIQRIGCLDTETGAQKAGCGGFGKGNFKDLFQSIEDYENSLNINSIADESATPELNQSSEVQ